VRELGLRLRVLVAALPVGLEQLASAVVGGPGASAWLAGAVPWLLAALTGGLVAALGYLTLITAADYPPLTAVGAGILGAALAVGLLILLLPQRAGLGARLLAAVLGAGAVGLLGSVFGTALVSAPLPAALLGGAATGLLVLGWRLQIAHSARSAASGAGLLPWAISVLLILSVLPVLQFGSELIITRATVSQFVDRQVGFSSTLLEMDGVALLLRFAAEPLAGPNAGQHWYLLREDAGADHAGLVRSPLDPATLSRRTVVARIDGDPAAVTAALDAFAARGAVAGEGSASDRVLVLLSSELAAVATEVRDLAGLDEVDGLAAGTLVRLALDFDGEGVALCAIRGDCQVRRLGRGVGPWEQLAHDPATGRGVVVRTGYPPSVAPMHVVGRQVPDQRSVDRFLSLPWVAAVTGWAQVLHAAMVQQDLSLPVDRLWLGPILFLLTAVLLWVGRRISYPVFQPLPDARPGGAPGAAQAEGLATGRLTPPGGSPVDVDAEPAVVRAATAGALLALPRRGLEVALPRALGSLSTLERGELRHVRARKPALRASWYGNQVQLLFRTDAERDAAAALLAGSAPAR
jgi:hypothetical protein